MVFFPVIETVKKPFKWFLRTRALENYNKSLRLLKKDWAKIEFSVPSLSANTRSKLNEITAMKELTEGTFLKDYRETLVSLNKIIKDLGPIKKDLEKNDTRRLVYAILCCMKELFSLILDMYPEAKNFVFNQAINAGKYLLRIKFSNSILTPAQMENLITVYQVFSEMYKYKAFLNSLFGVALNKSLGFGVEFISHSNVIVARLVRSYKIIALAVKIHDRSPIKLTSTMDVIGIINACKGIYKGEYSDALTFEGHLDEMIKNYDKYVKCLDSQVERVRKEIKPQWLPSFVKF